MHDTAGAIGAAFLRQNSRSGHMIVELGAGDFNGTLRGHAAPGCGYIGTDITIGRGVDVVVSQDLPFRDQFADLVLASSVFEHDRFFWLTFLEMARILKPGGLIYINAPSNGGYHRYPIDSWRFYPDAGKALEQWGRRSNVPITLVESFIANRRADIWNDFVAIFQMDPVIAAPTFLSDQFACNNVWKIGKSEPLGRRGMSEDMVLIAQLRLALNPPQEIPEIVRQREFVEDMRRTGCDSRAARRHLAEMIAKQGKC